MYTDKYTFTWVFILCSCPHRHFINMRISSKCLQESTAVEMCSCYLLHETWIFSIIMNNFNLTSLCFGLWSWNDLRGFMLSEIWIILFFVKPICMPRFLRCFIFISGDIKMRRCLKGETDGYEMKKGSICTVMRRDVEWQGVKRIVTGLYN